MKFDRTLRHYLDALGALCTAHRGRLDTPIAGAAADSREIRPGWLFCAIRGSQADGAAYIPQALARGAAAIAALPEAAVPQDIPRLTVSDSYAAAGRIAECRFDYPARRLDLYGITGTNGKTTSAYLLRECLAAADIPCGMLGTVACDIGDGRPLPARHTTPAPFELQQRFAAMLANGLRAAAIEVSSHALSQGRLGATRCAGAIFTNLTRDHLDYHESFGAYFAAKQKLFADHLRPGAPAVINLDDPYGAELIGRLRARGHEPTIGFGRTSDADAVIATPRMHAAGSEFTLILNDNDPLPLRSPLVGGYNLYNLAGTAALALAIGIPREAVASAFARCAGAPGRLQAIPTGKAGFAVYVDYAHTDDALRNVLTALRRLLDSGRLIVVFGCGGDRDRSKRPLMGRVAATLADLVFVTSDNPRSENPETIIADILAGIADTRAVESVPDRREAIRAAIAGARPGDIVLIAGKGHETTQEIQGRREPFNDAAEAALALAVRQR